MGFKELEEYLEAEPVKTWFDICLFLDKIKDNRKSIPKFPDTFVSFKKSIQGGIALLTREGDTEVSAGVDGVLIAKLREVVGVDSKFFWLQSPNTKEEAKGVETVTVEAAKAFEGFDTYFKTVLPRGGAEYNALAVTIWEQGRKNAVELGKLVESKKIHLLVPVNVATTPTNIPLALAVAIVSEIMNIPVFNYNMEKFYWEDGMKSWQREKLGGTGANDHFFTNAGLGEVFSPIEMLNPWDSPKWFQATTHTTHVDHLTTKKGFSPNVVGVLTKDTGATGVSKFLEGLWKSCHESNTFPKLKEFLDVNTKSTITSGKLYDQVVAHKNRHYLPGLTRLEYMVYLKSLIDPSSFREEENDLKARVIGFGNKVIESYQGDINGEVSFAEKLYFFDHVMDLFNFYEGDDELAVDHSLSYRHRNRRHYHYRKITEQELYGVVTLLFHGSIKEKWNPSMKDLKISQDDFHGKDQLTAVREILQASTQEAFAIDDNSRLVNDLGNEKKPIAFFPSHQTNFIAEFVAFVVIPLRRRLGLKDNEKITEEAIKKHSGVSGVTIFARETPFDIVTFTSLGDWINATPCDEISLLHKHNLISVQKTGGIAVGIHFGQLGEDALQRLVSIQSQNGFVVATGYDNVITMDLLDINSYRVARVSSPLEAAFMNVNVQELYVQWVPAGLRPSLAYPTPVQTPREFSEAINSKLWETAVKQFPTGEEKLLQILREDADTRGTPIQRILDSLKQEKSSKKESLVQAQKLTGLHADTAPWSGAMVTVKPATGEQNWNFEIYSKDGGATVMGMISEFEKKTSKSVSVGWNGGYMLNGELVGKLGLPEDYIGSPLGLIISNKDVLSLPLYNKPAIVFYADGRFAIKKANLKDGLDISVGGKELSLSPNQLNPEGNITDFPSFYDLLHKSQVLPTKDKLVFRFAGNKLIQRGEGADELPLLPVGITVTVPVSMKDKVDTWQPGSTVIFKLKGKDWVGVDNSVEAGPILAAEGKVVIDMEGEGWKTSNSIRTQAARLDYTDMRGPKIGAGITKDGELIVVAINGRIRESVGATHFDLADILVKQGAIDAMGFDPGGSVTVVALREWLNISPYNKGYEQSPLSMPPQPRSVGNAILGVLNG